MPPASPLSSHWLPGHPADPTVSLLPLFISAHASLDFATIPTRPSRHLVPSLLVNHHSQGRYPRSESPRPSHPYPLSKLELTTSSPLLLCSRSDSRSSRFPVLDSLPSGRRRRRSPVLKLQNAPRPLPSVESSGFLERRRRRETEESMLCVFSDAAWVFGRSPYPQPERPRERV